MHLSDLVEGFCSLASVYVIPQYIQQNDLYIVFIFSVLFNC
jgi:hypothetical protein